jgi:hypothetical protein
MATKEAECKHFLFMASATSHAKSFIPAIEKIRAWP